MAAQLRMSHIVTVIGQPSFWYLSTVLLRFDRHFQHTVPAFAEEFVRFNDLFQCEGVRQQRREIDSTVANNLHQPAHAFLTTRAECSNYSMIADAGGKCVIGNLKFP